MADGDREPDQQERRKVSRVDAVALRQRQDNRSVPRLPNEDAAGGGKQERDEDPGAEAGQPPFTEKVRLNPSSRLTSDTHPSSRRALRAS